MNMATKRVILANGSRLWREVLQHAIGKADQLEVVQEVPTRAELPSAIQRFEPEWVIVSLSGKDRPHGWIDACIAELPAVRFILFSPDERSVKIRSQSSYGQDLTNLSLHDFLHILEKDLQRT